MSFHFVVVECCVVQLTTWKQKSGVDASLGFGPLGWNFAFLDCLYLLTQCALSFCFGQHCTSLCSSSANWLQSCTCSTSSCHNMDISFLWFHFCNRSCLGVGVWVWVFGCGCLSVGVWVWGVWVWDVWLWGVWVCCVWVVVVCSRLCTNAKCMNQLGSTTTNAADSEHKWISYKKCLHFSICACHPCAGAMLIFSVSFQF